MRARGARVRTLPWVKRGAFTAHSFSDFVGDFIQVTGSFSPHKRAKTAPKFLEYFLKFAVGASSRTGFPITGPLIMYNPGHILEDLIIMETEILAYMTEKELLCILAVLEHLTNRSEHRIDRFTEFCY